jgi:hypothetical protein
MKKTAFDGQSTVGGFSTRTFIRSGKASSNTDDCKTLCWSVHLGRDAMCNGLSLAGLPTPPECNQRQELLDGCIYNCEH